MNLLANHNKVCYKTLVFLLAFANKNTINVTKKVRNLGYMEDDITKKMPILGYMEEDVTKKMPKRGYIVEYGAFLVLHEDGEHAFCACRRGTKGLISVVYSGRKCLYVVFYVYLCNANKGRRLLAARRYILILK